MRAARTLLIGLALVALLAAGCEWHFETLDGAGGPNGRISSDVGRFGTSSVIYNGRPHVFYYDHDNGDLRHAYYTGSAWGFETLDGNGGPNGRTTHIVGTASVALLYNGRPHVFYHDLFGNLRHAYYTGSAWAFETLDGLGGPNGRTTDFVGNANAAVLYNGRPHVFYNDSDNGTLRHAYYTGSAWGFETLDGAGGPNGRIMEPTSDPSVLLYNGRPHVFYRGHSVVVDGDLRHAYYTGSAWAFETLDGLGGPNGRLDANVGTDSAVTLYNQRPHVFYQNISGEDLRHAYYTGSAWGFETLDGNGGPNGRTTQPAGFDPSVVLYNRRPSVFYRAGPLTGQVLRQARYTGSAWAFESLDGTAGANGRLLANVGDYGSAVIYNGRPDVFYFDDTNTDLRHGYYG